MMTYPYRQYPSRVIKSDAEAVWVQTLHFAAGLELHQIAKSYGTSESVISKVIQCRGQWKHLPPWNLKRQVAARGLCHSMLEFE